MALIDFPLLGQISLTSSEQYFLEFIQDNTKFFISSSIAAIAKRSNIGVATISRFGHKLGFDSFRDLQMFVYKKFSTILNSENIVESNAIKDTINNIEIYLSYALEQTISAIDAKQIDKLAQYIYKCPRIIVYGAGNSQTAGRELALNLQKMGKYVITNQDFHQILTTIANLNANDIIIIISKNMSTRECNFLAKISVNYKIPLAIITNNIEKAQTFHPLFLIHTITLEQKHRATALSSKIAQLCIIEILLNQYTNYKKNIVSKQERTMEILNLWNDYKSD